ATRNSITPWPSWLAEFKGAQRPKCAEFSSEQYPELAEPRRVSGSSSVRGKGAYARMHGSVPACIQRVDCGECVRVAMRKVMMHRQHHLMQGRRSIVVYAACK